MLFGIKSMEKGLSIFKDSMDFLIQGLGVKEKGTDWDVDCVVNDLSRDGHGSRTHPISMG